MPTLLVQGHDGIINRFDNPNELLSIANNVWDVGSLAWVKETQAGGGGGAVTIADGADVAEGTRADAAWVSGSGTVISLLKKIASAGGSAVSIADGADVAEGLTTDAAVITDATGTLSGKLRGLVKWAFERMPASLGQKTMAASLPVVIASDQSGITANAGTNLNTSLLLLDASFLARINTQGQKTMALSTPIVIASDQSAVPMTLASTTITGTVAVTQATAANLNATVKLIDSAGVNLASVDANGALAIQAGGATGAAVPSRAIQVAGSDGTNLRAIKVSTTGVVSVDGSAVTQPVSGAVTANLPADIVPATQNITTQDLASASVTGANGQLIVTGTPTAGSVATFSISAEQSIIIQSTGTWTGTLQVEISLDSGTTWYLRFLHQVGTDYFAKTLTSNFSGGINIGGFTNCRVRAIGVMTGTAAILITESRNLNSVFVTNSLRISDPVISSQQMAVNSSGAASIFDSTGSLPYLSQMIETQKQTIQLLSAILMTLGNNGNGFVNPLEADYLSPLQ